MNIEQLNEGYLDAISNGKIQEAIDYIIQGASIHAKTSNGNNAIALAISKKQFKAFEWLLEIDQKGKKIDLNNQNVVGETPLFVAIKNKKSLNYINALIEKGADTNIINNSNLTPLIQAVLDNQYEEIKVLLDCPQTDVNFVVPHTKNTAFLSACSVMTGIDSTSIVQSLIDKGADINALDAEGKNALLINLHRNKRFMSDEEKLGNAKLTDMLLDSGIDVNYKAPSGMTAIWVAIYMNELGVLEKILTKGVNVEVPHAIFMEEDMSPLGLLITNCRHNLGASQFIPLLMNLGADLNKPNSRGNTPGSFGYLIPELRPMMLALGADVNGVIHRHHANYSIEKISVLENAIRSGDAEIDIIKEMINKGAEVSYQGKPGFEQIEPIFTAVLSYAPKVIEALFDTKKIDPNSVIKLTSSVHSEKISLLSFVVNRLIMSPEATQLMKEINYCEKILAAEEENKRNGVVTKAMTPEMLLEIKERYNNAKIMQEGFLKQAKEIFDKVITEGADVNYVNNIGNTPIFYSSSVLTNTWLIDNGADIFKINNEGTSPLIHHLLLGTKDVFKDLYERYSAEQPEYNLFYDIAFLKNNSNLQRTNIENALNSILSEEDFKFIQEDKKNTIQLDNINYQDKAGNSPLIAAAANDNAFLVNLYYKFGADVNLTNNKGETALMHAIASDNDRVVEFLLEKGADVMAKTHEGKSILEFAEEGDNRDILEAVKTKIDPALQEGTFSGYKKLSF